jgi:hypothetical protein
MTEYGKKSQILSRLCEIETKEKVRIVYACESGSRAWGFPSADSDYDVRFLYFRPVEWYLSIDVKRDVIERPVHDGLDIRLGYEKSLAVVSQIQSTSSGVAGFAHRLLEQYDAAEGMRGLLPDYYSPLLLSIIIFTWHGELPGIP